MQAALLCQFQAPSNLGAFFVSDQTGPHAAISAGSTRFASRSGMDRPAARGAPMFGRPPRWAQELITKVDLIMALVSVEQAELDVLAVALEDVKAAIAAEIASLSTAVPAADVSGLTKALADLQALVPPAPAPAS